VEAMDVFVEIKKIVTAVEGNAISDADVVKAVDELVVVTNCTTAAKIYWQAVAPVLHFRPHLEEKLLLYPIEPIVYSSATNDLVEAVVRWIKGYLANDEHIIQAGRTYLEKLSEQKELLQKIVDLVPDEDDDA
jgi:hypothetical protein